jgi:hypothetical protein
VGFFFISVTPKTQRIRASGTYLPPVLKRSSHVMSRRGDYNEDDVVAMDLIVRTGYMNIPSTSLRTRNDDDDDDEVRPKRVKKTKINECIKALFSSDVYLSDIDETDEDLLIVPAKNNTRTVELVTSAPNI